MADVMEPSVPEGSLSKFRGDVNGGFLKPELAKAAHLTECEWVKKQHAWDIVLRRQSFEWAGRPPIPSRWVDTNKDDQVNPSYRSRTLARDMKVKKKGKAITFKDASGKKVTVKLSGRRTKITIGGKKAKRSKVKAGMTCEVSYFGNKGRAKKLRCE